MKKNNPNNECLTGFNYMGLTKALYSLESAAQVLDTTRDAIKKWVNEHQLISTVKIRGKLYVTCHELARFLSVYNPKFKEKDDGICS